MPKIGFEDFIKVEVVSAEIFAAARKPAYILHVDFGPIQSQCLVTGFHDESGAVVLCVPDKKVPKGTKLL